MLPVDGAGYLSPDDVAAAITPASVLVTVMHANNETGTLQPIRQISEVTRARGVLLHTDAAQSVGKGGAGGRGLTLLGEGPGTRGAVVCGLPPHMSTGRHDQLEISSNSMVVQCRHPPIFGTKYPRGLL